MARLDGIVAQERVNSCLVLLAVRWHDLTNPALSFPLVLDDLEVNNATEGQQHVGAPVEQRCSVRASYLKNGNLVSSCKCQARV